MTSEAHRSRIVWLSGLSLVAAPLLMLLADGLALPSAGGVTLVSVVLWLSFYVFIGAAIGVVGPAGHTPTALTGASLAVFGCLIGGTIMGLERMHASMLRHGVATDQAWAIMSDPAVLLTSRAPGLTFPVGLLLLTVALYRVGVLAPAMATLLAVGVVLFPIGRIRAQPAVNVIGDTLMLIVLGVLGLQVLRGGPSGADRASTAPNET